MTKKVLVTFFLLMTLFTAYKAGVFSLAPILNLSNSIKLVYLSTMQEISSFIVRHFAQAKTIQKLQEENEKLKKSAIVLNAFAEEILD